MRTRPPTWSRCSESTSAEERTAHDELPDLSRISTKRWETLNQYHSAVTNEPTTSTASVLFTDLVGSTELRTRLGEEVADDIRRRHDEVAAAAIEEAAGRVVKSTGDGLMAVCDSAADAVAAADRGTAACDRTRRRPTRADRHSRRRVGG